MENIFNNIYKLYKDMYLLKKGRKEKIYEQKGKYIPTFKIGKFRISENFI
jgi:hypothetical protein